MCNGNDTAEMFERIIKFQLLSSDIQHKMNLKITQKKRLSSSGALLESEDSEIKPISIQTGMIIALKLIAYTDVGVNFGDEFVQSLLDSLEGQLGNRDEIKSFLPILHKDHEPFVPTLNNIGVTRIGGLCNSQRYTRHQQVANFE